MYSKLMSSIQFQSSQNCVDLIFSVFELLDELFKTAALVNRIHTRKDRSINYSDSIGRLYQTSILFW